LFKTVRSKEETNFHWLQGPGQINGDNINNVRCEVGRHFRNREIEYLKDKINELATQ
jgi:hypothetical protein